MPAHACGVYSHKPTLDLVPEEGHIPPPPGIVGSTQLATLGPMARSADDLALLFDVLIDDSDVEAEDFATWGSLHAFVGRLAAA